MGPHQISNMHMDMQVIEVTDFKSGVRFDLRGCLEAAVASEDKKSLPAISLNICRNTIRPEPCYFRTKHTFLDKISVHSKMGPVYKSVPCLVPGSLAPLMQQIKGVAWPDRNFGTRSRPEVNLLNVKLANFLKLNIFVSISKFPHFAHFWQLEIFY